MANGVQYKSSVAITDQTGPTLYPDLNMSPGTLVLFDGSRSKPATFNNNALVPNVAAATAATLIGSSLPTDIYPYLSIGTNFNDPGIGKLEFSNKGGIHGIISQTNQSNKDTQFASIVMPTPIRNYIFNNPTHKYFISTWFWNTRKGAVGLDSAKMTLCFVNTSNYLAYERSSLDSTNSQSFRPTSSSLRLGARTTLIDDNVVTGPYIKNIGVNGLTGDPATAGALTAKGPTGNALRAWGGGVAAFSAAGIVNKSVSGVLYRQLIEDLTVSGRTYEQADAIDIYQFNQAFGVGGKYYGDSVPTNPSLIP